MTLTNDTCRCLGIYTSELGNTRCPRRDTCARYTQRHKGSERTPVAQWLCPSLDEFFGRYLKEESHE